MKLPGPDHPIAIAPHPYRVRIEVGGTTLAETDRALALKEAAYPVVLYIPRQDVEMAAFTKTAHHTHCPYKGDASYYTAHVGENALDNVAWSYEAPYPAMAEIAGCLAFYADRVTIKVDPIPDA